MVNVQECEQTCGPALDGQTCDRGWRIHECKVREDRSARWSSSRSRGGTTCGQGCLDIHLVAGLTLPGKEKVCEGLHGGEECKHNPVHHPLDIPWRVNHSKSWDHIQLGMRFLLLKKFFRRTTKLFCLTLWRSWSWLPCSWHRQGRGYPSPGRWPGRAGERSLRNLFSQTWMFE